MRSFYALGSVCLLSCSLGCAANSGDDDTSQQNEAGKSGSAGNSGAGSGGATSVGVGGTGGSSTVSGGAGSGGDAGAGGSAGSSAGNGSGGNPDPGTVTPLACDALDDAPAGVWENVTPADVPIGENGSGVPNVMANPLSPGELYICTYNKGVFKSTDCGATWAKVNTGRNAAALDAGTAWLFALDPVTPNVLYADTFGAENNLYKSTNGGVDWDPLWEPGGTVAVAVDFLSPMLLGIDPTNHEHIVVTIHADCKSPHPKLCFAESHDSGATWNIVDGPEAVGGWVEDAGPLVINSTTFSLGSAWQSMYLTTDDGDSWTNVSGTGGLRMVTAGEWSYVGSAFNLQRSKDLVTWTPLDATPGLVGYGLVQDGENIFASSRYHVDYRKSSVTDGATWTTMTPPSGLLNDTHGSFSLAIDTSHHLLYSGNQGSGLYRMKLAD